MTPGNVVDYDIIRQRLNELKARFRIREIGIDPWNVTQLPVQLESDHFKVITFGQNFKYLTAPTKEWEKLVLSRKLIHGGPPVLRWMASSVAAESDAAGNIKPANDRIDGIVAGIMGLGRALVTKPRGGLTLISLTR